MRILGHVSAKKETQRERDKGNDTECTLLETRNWEEVRGIREFGEKSLERGEV